MIATDKILPGTGRGTMRSMVEGPLCLDRGFDPSVRPTACHLPVPGRI
jgi:hypothetical protein